MPIHLHLALTRFIAECREVVPEQYAPHGDMLANACSSPEFVPDFIEGAFKRAEADVALWKNNCERAEAERDAAIQEMERAVSYIRDQRDEATRLMEHWKHLACDPQTRENVNRQTMEERDQAIAEAATYGEAIMDIADALGLETGEDAAEQVVAAVRAQVGELAETQAEVVGWHGVFSAVAAHLGCQARHTTIGNDHVIARAKFGSECISALWKIAWGTEPEAGLDPAGYAKRVIAGPLMAESDLTPSTTPPPTTPVRSMDEQKNSEHA